MSEALSEATPVSLLRKLQESTDQPAAEAWNRFAELYTPLFFLWARRVGVPEQEIPDLVQDVFLVLVREIRSYRREPGRRFRGWLWTILLNKWRDRSRSRQAAPAFVGSDALQTVPLADPVEELSESEYRTFLIGRVLEIMRAELPNREWLACREYIVNGRPAGEVAQELGLSVNQVYVAKSRILHRVREELEGLLDPDQ